MSSFPPQRRAYGFGAPHARLFTTFGGACLLVLSLMRLWFADGRPAMVSAAAMGIDALWMIIHNHQPNLAPGAI